MKKIALAALIPGCVIAACSSCVSPTETGEQDWDGSTQAGGSASPVGPASKISIGAGVLRDSNQKEGCLLKGVFDLPGDGVPNNNGSIGPFLGTGETMIVQRADHVILGYAYFYGWEGQAYMVDDTSYAPDMYMFVAAASGMPKTNNWVNNPFVFVKSKVSFSSAEIENGAEKTVAVGILSFRVKTVLADMITLDGQRMFDMRTFRVQIKADLAQGQVCKP